MPNNIRARKSISEAVKTMPTPFSARELAQVVNLDPRRVSCILRSMDGLLMIPKTNGRERMRFMREDDE